MGFDDQPEGPSIDIEGIDPTPAYSTKEAVEFIAKKLDPSIGSAVPVGEVDELIEKYLDNKRIFSFDERISAIDDIDKAWDAYMETFRLKWDRKG